ncbi:MAG TPA: TIGR01777 family oxidoreductase [Candidatus Nitrosocosmicus sp.]|nr:TIGR01777 family oxidoreductase [Candidatus Nitrosocosmicus sp.]
MSKFTIQSMFERVPIDMLFDWHTKEGAFERLNPPWMQLYITSKKGSIDNGGIVTVKLPFIRGIVVNWKVKHTGYVKNKSFTDTQIKGFFSHWEHQHNFFDFGNNSALEDKIEYDAKLGPLKRVFSRVIDANLKSMFQYRHRITKMDIDTHQSFKNPKIQKILISGSNGFIGSALIPFLTTGGYDVSRLLRNNNHKPVSDGEYDIAKRINLYPSETLQHRVDGKYDAVINLNGDNIFGLWSKAKKKKIFDSRVKHTRSLCTKLSEMDKPPKVLISASAIGIYGNNDKNGDKVFDDTDEFRIDGDSNNLEEHDYLSYVCSKWEEATDVAKNAGIRVVNLRTGIVLGSSGGILKKMVVLNRLKTNMSFNHDNWLSWISLDDLLRIILFCMCNDNISGPVNAVSRNCVQFTQFMKVLEKIWKTKLNIRIQPQMIKTLLGEMSRYTILSDIKSTPGKLITNGFDFVFDDLESALRHTLGKV